MSWQQQRWALQIHQASGALFVLLMHGRYKDLRLGFLTFTPPPEHCREQRGTPQEHQAVVGHFRAVMLQPKRGGRGVALT